MVDCPDGFSRCADATAGTPIKATIKRIRIVVESGTSLLIDRDLHALQFFSAPDLNPRELLAIVLEIVAVDWSR